MVNRLCLTGGNSLKYFYWNNCKNLVINCRGSVRIKDSKDMPQAYNETMISSKNSRMNYSDCCSYITYITCLTSKFNKVLIQRRRWPWHNIGHVFTTSVELWDNYLLVALTCWQVQPSLGPKCPCALQGSSQEMLILIIIIANILRLLMNKWMLFLFLSPYSLLYMLNV